MRSCDSSPHGTTPSTGPTGAGRDRGRAAQDRGTHMRGVGPSAPRRDNETKIQDAAREPRGAQADGVKQRAHPLHPCPSRLGRPFAQCYAESMLMVAVAPRLCGRPRAFPCPGLSRCLAGPRGRLVSACKDASAHETSHPGVYSACIRHTRNTSSRSPIETSKKAPVIATFGCGTGKGTLHPRRRTGTRPWGNCPRPGYA